LDDQILGVIYPITPALVRRIFTHRKTVLVKYVSRLPKKFRNYRLKSGMTVYFYVSRSQRRLAGYGIIHSLDFLPAAEALRKYGGQLMLSSSELAEYSKMQPNRDSKPMLVLELEGIHRYPASVKYHKTLTMAGEYMKPEAYARVQDLINST
jgi:hypothetical protein